MIIGIIANEIKDKGLTVSKNIADAVAARGGKAVIATGADFDNHNGKWREARSLFARDRDALSECDVLISIGGDGTLIKIARETVFCGAPILGVNLGSLGYLTEVETFQIDEMLDRIFTRDYHVEERMMLSITRISSAAYDMSRGDCEETALNELAVGREDRPHVIRLKVYVNDTFFDVYSGDGLLISTPTGSTAYALSAGGPVIDPELNVISIVPVCPHVIFSRPVLIAPDKEITIIPVNVEGAFRAGVSIDGLHMPELCEGEILKIRKSKHIIKMLRFNADNFYVVLKNKLFNTSLKYESEISYIEM